MPPERLGNQLCKNWGVDSRLGPPKSWGYVNIKKKYKCPMRMPMSSITPPFAMIRLNANSTHGRYIALNWVPNQKVTMVSLFNWHQMYKTARTKGSIKTMMFMKRPTITAQIQMKPNKKA